MGDERSNGMLLWSTNATAAVVLVIKNDAQPAKECKCEDHVNCARKQQPECSAQESCCGVNLLGKGVTAGA